MTTTALGVGEPPVTGQDEATGSRARLLDVSVGLVEDVRGAARLSTEPTCGFSPAFQVALPYRGMFVWHVGSDEVVGNANHVLFVTGGEGYRVSQPLAGGFAELIVTPHMSVLSEITWRSGTSPIAHPLFRRRTRRVTPDVQRFRTWLLHCTARPHPADPMAVDEAVLALLDSTLSDAAPGGPPGGPSTARLIRRTKAFLEAEMASPIRLADIGRAVGASPAYLTHLFRRVEGTSLHRYLTELRLSRSLVDLPHTDNLTALALDIGFSSHSHFTAAFRQAFGCTPSAFRESMRQRVPPRPNRRAHDLRRHAS